MSFGMMEALLSFFRRQVGLRTDAADAAGSLHAKVGYIGNKVSDVPGDVWGYTTRCLSGVTAGGTVRLSSMSEVGGYNGNWAKQVMVNVEGRIRVSVEGRGASVMLRFYLNSTQFSEEWMLSDWKVFSKDLYVKKGDSIWVAITCGDDWPGYLRNFMVSWVYSPSPFMGYVMRDQ